jgi:hypothetical protein
MSRDTVDIGTLPEIERAKIRIAERGVISDDSLVIP